MNQSSAERTKSLVNQLQSKKMCRENKKLTGNTGAMSRGRSSCCMSQGMEMEEKQTRMQNHSSAGPGQAEANSWAKRQTHEQSCARARAHVRPTHVPRQAGTCTTYIP